MLTWESLEKICLPCTKCRLCETRTNVVFGTGDRNADILFIGEGPGEQEDLQGEPFVGRSGKLLDQYLESVSLSRSQVYIANIVKCRPPENRDPRADEEEACIDYLRAQVKLLKPKIIVCLGRVAAMKIIRPDFKITAERGTWTERGTILMTATFHPAAVLRDPRKKSDMMLDFIAIKHKLDELQQDKSKVKNHQ